MKALLPLLLLAACATWDQAAAPAASSARQCFRPADVSGFRPVDRNTVIVSVGPRDRFRLDLMAPCPDVNWSERIGIRSPTMRICTGLDAEIIAPSSIGPRTCPVRAVTRLTREEADALIAGGSPPQP